MDGSENKGFEAFLDWEEVDDEMVHDFHKALQEFELRKGAFMVRPDKDSAVNLLKSQDTVMQISKAIHQAIWTQPVMVHVAGEVQEETDDEGDDVKIQRCSRCGSALQLWRPGAVLMTPAGPMSIPEDEVPWWKKGDIIAKHVGDGMMGIYQIDPDRELEKYEMPCLDMNNLLGDA